AAAVDARLAVEAREHAALLARARAEHEVDLAEAVIVDRLIVDRDLRGLLFAREDDAPRRAVERHTRRLIGDRLERGLLRLRHDDLAEARDDAELHGLAERPPRDDVARAVLDEGDLRVAVGEEDAAAGVHGDAAERDERAAREGDVFVGRD